MPLKLLYVLILLALFTSCSKEYYPQLLNIPFSAVATPPPPDYSNTCNWAALPDKDDNADKVPSHTGIFDEQLKAEADVFFIHPTLYLKTNSISQQWNAEVDDTIVNKKVDESTILYQASVFNGAGKIYAPRYRQAHISAYYSDKREDTSQAFDSAYSDVMRAFQYYLKFYNKGRPFILAAHSQGTTHAIRLLKDFFERKPLLNQLICAYIIGMPVYDTSFTAIKPCATEGETGCYVSWRTYDRNYFPKNYVKPDNEIVCTNPLSWKTDSIYVSRNENKGGILKNFNKVIPRLTDAQVADGVLRIKKPHFFGNVFINIKNYHIVDFNLFYLNIRENAKLRVKKFMEK